VSDDDLIRRGDVRDGFADYSSAAGDDFNDTLDGVPADPYAAAAIRLAAAVLAEHEAWDGVGGFGGVFGPPGSEQEAERRTEETSQAVDAFRAAREARK